MYVAESPCVSNLANIEIDYFEEKFERFVRETKKWTYKEYEPTEKQNKKHLYHNITHNTISYVSCLMVDTIINNCATKVKARYPRIVRIEVGSRTRVSNVVISLQRTFDIHRCCKIRFFETIEKKRKKFRVRHRYKTTRQNRFQNSAPVGTRNVRGVYANELGRVVEKWLLPGARSQWGTTTTVRPGTGCGGYNDAYYNIIYSIKEPAANARR